MHLHRQEINKTKPQSEQSDQSQHRETGNLQSGGEMEELEDGKASQDLARSLGLGRVANNCKALASRMKQ